MQLTGQTWTHNEQRVQDQVSMENSPDSIKTEDSGQITLQLSH